MVELTQNPILPELVASKVKAEAYGALVTFVGTARGYSEGKRVLYLEYDAYKEMAEKKLREIADEIRTRWQPANVAICHRTGKVEVGETCVVIAVAAPHRKEAFEACQYAIDRLKQVVPIWKKEVREDGEVWIEH